MDHDGGFIFLGVHMLFEGKFESTCGKEKCHNNLVYIGRDLNCDIIHMSFTACLL